MTRPRSAPEILATPVRELGLDLARSSFAPAIARLEREMERAGIRLRPRFYLSTEYGCLAGTATIGLLWTDGFPFSHRLAHKRGIRTRRGEQILRTLRHEAGHAFCYAHRLYRTPRFRTLFGVRGNFFDTYPEVWKPSARDRRREKRGEVILLYGARHPDEDFAVCFEHWLTFAATGKNWRTEFRRKPVLLEKLAYVEDIVRRRGRRAPKVGRPPLDEPVSAVRLPVGAWMDAVLAGSNYNLHRGTPVG